MKKLILVLCLCSSTVFADTPIKDLNVTNTADIESGATLTFKAGSKLVVQPTIVISAVNIDWSVAQTFSKTLAADSTFTFSNVTDGRTIVVVLTNTASNYTVTFPVDVRWAGGTQPVQTVGAKTDVWTFVRSGTTTYGSVVQSFPTPTPSPTPTATP